MAEVDKLTIPLEKLCFIIGKSQQFDGKDVLTDSGNSSNATDDGMRSVLEDDGNDPVYTELIPARLNTDPRPIAFSDCGDRVWVLDEPDPGRFAGFEDVVIAFPDPGVQHVLPQIAPDILHWVQFGTVGWQRQRADILGLFQPVTFLIPNGLNPDS